jgi:hypothetical protein
MASTNKTGNLQLNQWVPTDPVLREDFNLDNSVLDAAVSARALVRITGKTLTTAASSLDLDLLYYDLTQYSQLQLLFLPKTSATSVSGGAMTSLSVNGGTATDLARMASDGTRGLEIHLTLLPGGVGGHYWAMGDSASGGLSFAGITAESLTGLSLKCGDSGVYQAGTACILYGIRQA